MSSDYTEMLIIINACNIFCKMNDYYNTLHEHTYVVNMSILKLICFIMW